MDDRKIRVLVSRVNSSIFFLGLTIDWSFGIDLTEDSVPARQIVDQS